MKALLIAAALGVGFAASALAATDTNPAAKPANASCFSSINWKGWKARDANTMYLKVGMRDVYEVGFKQGCPEAGRIGAKLITIFRGSTNVCRPIDLDIRVTDDNHTPAVACIATSLRKLPAAEATAIPKQYQP